MIEVKDLTKRYGGFQALRGATFSIARGEVVGFLGPNGAGKTTTMKILTGFIRSTSGSARIAGLDVDRDGLEVRRRVGYLPENAPLYADMLVREYLDFMADVRRIDRSERLVRIDEVSDRCGIGDVLAVPIGQLSKGYRQRVGLAQALLHRPDLLILDEPTSGLDPNQIVEIRELLREVGKEKTVILSTHILREVEVTCGRVLIINAGEIVADARPQDLQKGDTLLVSGRGAPQGEMEAALRSVGHVQGVTSVGGDRYKLKTDGDKMVGEEVFKLAKEKGWILSEIRSEDSSLEEVFHQLTSVN